MSEGRGADVGWDDQRAFLAVIEEGSLSGAARRLGLSQPTVRARVAALERALGGALFVRSVNGMVPTRAAAALAEHVRAMRRASEAMARAASAAGEGIGGVVRLSVSEFVGIEVIPPMLATLRARHPALDIELALSNESANILEQEVDVALRMTDPKQRALVARRVATFPIGFFAHRDYLARRGVPLTLAELAGHDVIGPDRSTSDLRFAARLGHPVAPEGFALRTDSHPAAFAAVRAGLGVGAVLAPVAARNPDLVRVLPELRIGVLETWLVTHEDLRRVPRVRAVLDHLAKAFADGGFASAH